MEHFGFKYGFLFFSGIFLILALFTYLVIKEMPEEAGAYPDNDKTITREQLNKAMEEKLHYQSNWTIALLLKSKTMWLTGISMGLLWMVVVGIAGQWIPRIVSLGYKREFAIHLLMVNGIIGLFGSYIWGYIDQKLGTKKACILYGFFYIFELLCLLFLTSKNAMYFVTVVAGIGTGGIANLIPSLIGTIWGRWDFSAANRILNPITNFLKGSAALVASFALTKLNGYNSMYRLILLFCVISIILLFLLDDTKIGKTD